MARLSPEHLWEHQHIRFIALMKSDVDAFHAVAHKFGELAANEEIFNHEAMQMAVDSVIGPEEGSISLSCQADEYDETIKAQEIWDSL